MAKIKRRQITRKMLLPLSEHKASATSLEHHVALSVLCSGAGTADQAAKLTHVLYHGKHMCDVRDPDATAARLRSRRWVDR